MGEVGTEDSVESDPELGSNSLSSRNAHRF